MGMDCETVQNMVCVSIAHLTFQLRKPSLLQLHWMLRMYAHISASCPHWQAVLHDDMRHTHHTSSQVTAPTCLSTDIMTEASFCASDKWYTTGLDYVNRQWW